MDYDQAAELLRSEDTDKQLAALNSIFPVISILPPGEEFLTALIERGLSCEKSHLVRQLAFQCIDLLYSTRITRWGDVRAAISAELGTAESPECLFAAIRVLYNLPMADLVCLVGSKDMMSVMKGCLQAENVLIVAIGVENLGPLLVDTWLYVQSTNTIEGIIAVESTAEARRFRDDILDFVGEIFKNFSLGAVGRAPSAEVNQLLPDHSRPLGAYFSVLADLSERYFACHEDLHRWTASLLGCVLPTPPPRGDADVTSRSASLALLLRQVLPTLLADPYLLFARYQQMPFHAGILSCISHIILALLLALPGESNLLGFACSLVFEEKASLQFSSPLAEDETAASRSQQMEINIVKIAEDWLLHHLMGTVKSVSPGDVTLAAYAALSMLQSPFLMHRRDETYPLILENMHRILLHGPLSVPHRTEMTDQYATTADYHKLIPWALLSCRFVPRSVMGDYLPSLLEQICAHISDDVSRSKLFAEVAALLLLDIADSGGVAHPDVLYAVLSHSFVVKMLQTEAPSGSVSSQHSYLRERLLLALCRGAVKMLPVSIAYVLSAAQKAGGVSSSHLQGSSSAAHIDDAFGAPALMFSTTATASDCLPHSGALPFSGMGLYTTFPDGNTEGPDRQPGDAESVERAVRQMESAIACAVFILRSCHKCMVWPTDGNAGEALQLSYVELVAVLAELIAPVHRKANGVDDPRSPTFLQEAVAWAKGPFVDIVSADLTQLEAQDKAQNPFPTQNVRMKYLLVLSQYAGVMFADAVVKVKSISALLRAVLLRSKERERYTSTISTRAARGYLGGAVAAHPTHSFLFAPVQQHALTLLEMLARHHSALAAEHVLSILYECEALCVAEGRRNHHIVCPSLDERLSLAIRRVKLCCPDGSGSTVRRPKSFRLDVVLPQVLLKEDNAKNSKLISQRKLSGAFSTYDNSMSDVFVPENRLRRVSARVQQDTVVAHEVLDAVWRLSVEADSFSLPVDVQKEYGAFSLQALSGSEISDAKAGEYGKRNHISSVDVIAVIDDVLDAHMSVPPSAAPAPADLRGSSATMGRVQEVRDCRQWMQVNGSCDLFSVLGAITSCDPLTGNVDVCFRVINSSGFKVPIFALQVLLGIHEQSEPSGKEMAVTFETDGQTSRGGSADGLEYFLPGAIVERTFNFRVQRLSTVFVVLRVVYHELMPEMDTVETFALTTPASTQLLNDDSSPNVEMNGDSADSKKRFKEYEVPRMATFDSIPLPIPAVQLLVPYGGGALSSMVHYSSGGGEYCSSADFVGGIPKGVFQCLHSRLRRMCRLPVLSVPRLTSQGTTEARSFADEVTLALHRLGQHNSTGSATPRAPSWWWENGPHWSLGMASRVRLGQAASTRNRQMSSVLSWCLQDWWGEEICVSIRVSKISCNTQAGNELSDRKDVYWSGWMDIRCNSRLVLATLTDDATNLLYGLTGGLMRLSRPDSSTAASQQQQSIPFPEGVDMRAGPEDVHRRAATVSISALHSRSEGVSSGTTKSVCGRNFMLDKILTDAPPVAELGGVASFL